MAQTILLVQEDPADAKAVREALIHSGEGPFRVEWIKNSSEALQRLSGQGQHGADVIAAVLLDLFLPDSCGIDTFERLFHAAPQIPILVLSAPQHEALAKLAVQRGAQDYLLKDRLDNHLLPKALRSMVERAANAEALFEEKERAEVTLNSIGDAVMSSDVSGKVTYLNVVAESMTSRSREEAAGQRLEDVFRIVVRRRRIHDAGDSGEQNRLPHTELHSDPARRSRGRHREIPRRRSTTAAVA
jgi:CheY-like chemotaxis protein